ncbi:4-hydroxy-tetrahydrodipicolinate synthase [Desmospora activa DSM 45169]|uniref:4-hydroxy-tetrahydrodipicolinate synthase n=1 Tax=Desmospora activa DSM 45169 TaxID=1121389 RepID=A0A2T4ZAP0_9BACL|nr:4-hydroxy-tetrahydrodipicolinate synthase [Desmospora activa DSM 45169]
MQFGRLLTAMITPFTSDGTVDWPRFDAVLEHLINHGSDSVVIAGTTGESPTLAHDEKLQLFKRAVQRAQGRVKVIAGTGSNDTIASQKLTQEAEAIGVNGVMLVVPYYNKPTQEGLYQHFRKVAGATSLPVMLYNVPGRTALHMDVDTMVRLTHDVPNITSIKESSGRLVDVMKLAAHKREDVELYSGMDELIIPYLASGADGVVSVASHVAGLDMKQMIEAFINGEIKTATAMQQRLIPLVEALFMTSSPAPLKYALSRMGLCEESVRQPILPLSDAEKKEMDSILQGFVLAEA